MKKHKYSAKKTEAHGKKFPSKKEAARWGELLLLEKAGAISNLEYQPRYPLRVNGQLICTYVADSDYFENNKRVVEDVKGFKTPVYRLKKKLLLALNPGLDHREI